MALAGAVPIGKLRYLDDISEAVMNTIKWSDEVALAKRSFPEIQDEIQDEIDKLRTSCLTGNSFVPGTLVLLADGSTKPIEEVELGDRVVATDPETGESGPQKVVATIVGHGEKNLVEVTVDVDGDAGDAVSTIMLRL